MSEDITGAVAESAPSSTQDIAASVIETAERETPTETPGYVAPAETAAAPEPELTAAQKFLLAQGHKPKKEDGRPVWLPYQTIEKMLDRYAEGPRNEWETTRQRLERERDEYRGNLERFENAFKGDEKAFIAEVAKYDPRYARFLQEQKAEQQPSVAMPGPDVDLPDGGKTYSVEGLQKLIDWAVDARMMPKVDERLKPLTEREQKAQEETKQREWQAGRLEMYRKQMAEAETWPKFGKLSSDGSLTEFQQAVLEEMKKDKSVTFRQAYLEAIQRDQEPEKVRAQVLEELKTGPKVTSVGRQTAETTRKPGPKSTQDIARDTIRQLEAS